MGISMPVTSGPARFYTYVSLATTLFLAACGGGGGGTTHANPDGIYKGTFTENGVTADVTGLVYGGRLILFSESAEVLIDGTIAVSGTDSTVSAASYDAFGLVDTGTLTGTVDEGASLSGTYSTALGDTGSYSLTFDPIYNRSASLATLADTWSDATWAATHGFDAFTFSALSNGSFTGSDTGGCLFDGTLAPVSPGINIYIVAMTVSSCGAANGNFTGYATTDDTTATNDTLFLVASGDNDFFFISVLARQ
jgi:hypothetical protein